MEEGSTTVRLVRCPNCQNLLHELPDYSVYQCGGCGAVLRAKAETMSGGLLEKYDDKRGRGRSENEGCFSVHCATETENEGDEHHGGKEGGAFRKRTVNLITSPSASTENKGVGNDFDQNRTRNSMNIRLNQSNFNRVYMDKHREALKRPISNWVNEDDHDINMNFMTSKLVNLNVENALEKFRHPIGNGVRSLGLRPVMDQSSLERKPEEHGRDSTSPYPDEGNSNYHPRSFLGYSEQVRIHNDLDGPSQVGNLENDRSELLRKLGELQDQLNRSCDVVGKPKERGPVYTKTAPPPALSNAYRFNEQPFAQGKHGGTPHNFNHSHGPISYSYSRGLDMQGFYPPPRNVLKEFLGYEDFYIPPMLGRPPHQPPSHYLEQPYHDHFPRKRTNFNQNLVLGSYETYLHQPAYSNFHRYNENSQIPSKIPPPVYRRSPDDPANPILYHHVDPVTRDPWGYNSRGANPPRLHSRDGQPQARTTSDLDSDTGGFGYHHQRRVVMAHGSGRVCHPIVGGAPFVTCCNCFELLKLPRRFMARRNNQMKVRCGACSTILLVELEKKGLLVSIPVQSKQTLKSSHGYLDPCATNSYSEDFHNSGYNFQLTEVESNFLSVDQRLNFSKSDKEDPLSSSSNFSEDEQSPDSVIVMRDVSNSAELSSKDDTTSLPVPNSSPQEQSYYSSSNNDQEKVILHRSTSRQNSEKDVPMITDVEVPIYGGLNSSVSHDYVEVSKEEYLNTGVSQDYVEVSEEHRTGINEGRESFFIGLIKKSFSDFSRSSQKVEGGRSCVYVNGQLIPDHVVKKAEKMAGLIQPGEYWYDFRAGFWGVLGEPCLGIIPPFIEEFNYPMPDNCRGGNTGVFVNGRELHQNDLDLLSCRGLPTTRDKSYLIDFSGRLFDETSCEELDSIGKLAPTVERVKRGFGMKVPRAVAQ